MDILADPDNPEYWPLKLKVFKSEVRERPTKPHPHENGLLCKFYCYLKNQYLVTDPLDNNEKTLSTEELTKITDLDTCYDCITLEIIDGILYHEKTSKLKWFIIDREIPVMYPLNLRDTKQERKFVNEYQKQCEELGISLSEI